MILQAFAYEYTTKRDGRNCVDNDMKKKTRTWLRNGNLKRKSGFLLIAAEMAS